MRRTLTGFGSLTLTLLQLVACGRAGAATLISGSLAMQAGRTPSGIACGDLDGDGRPDIAIPNSGDSTVTVGFLDADGVPTTTETLRLSGEPGAIAVGDVTGDGRADLVLSLGVDAQVAILPSFGGGAFGPQISLGVLAGPDALALADLDLDGHSDIAVASTQMSKVSILFGTGGGAFRRHVDYAVGSVPSAIAVGDLTGDGRPDVVVTSEAGNVLTVWRGTATGAFTGRIDLVCGHSPEDVKLGDIDGDGKLDIVTAASADSAVDVMVGHGDGTFAPPVELRVGKGPCSVALVDLTRDGVADVVTADLIDCTLSVRRGTGGGAFASRSIVNLYTQPSALLAADTNHDGMLDVVALEAMESIVALLQGTGDGGFDVGLHQSLPGTCMELCADVTQDGRADLITAWHQVTVRPGRPDGSFGPPITSPEAAFEVIDAIADFTRDGIPDLLVSADDTLAIQLGLGGGTFAVRNTIAVIPGSGAIPQIAVADLDRDGVPDILLTREVVDTLTVLLLDGTAHVRSLAGYALPPGSFLNDAPLPGDFTEDGIPDVIVAAGSLSPRIVVLRGLGSGAFAPATSVSDPLAYVTPHVLADFTGDGHLDLLGTTSDDSLAVLPGSGTGAFGAVVRSNVLAPGGPWASADLDGDGIGDLVSSDGTTLLADGHGAFRLSARYLAFGWIAAGDVDGDHRPDLVAVTCDDAWTMLHAADSPTRVSQPPSPPRAPGTLSIRPGSQDAVRRVRFLVHGDAVELVSLEVLDVRGRHVRRVTARLDAAGAASLAWDGRDGQGTCVAAGVYLARVSGKTGAANCRVVLVP